MPTEMVALPSEPHAAPEAPSAPELQRQVVGRYSAGSANYVVFADGGIEAETKEGAFRFASMGEFKTFIAKRNG